MPSTAVDRGKKARVFERSEFRPDPRGAQGTDAASSHRHTSGGSGFGDFCQDKSYPAA
jgi:hypothetical protein